MGFTQVARPQHTVSEHIYHELCRTMGGIGESIQRIHNQPAEFESFMQRAEHMRITATQGGLLELNAACEAYHMQAVVCVRAKDHFVVLGKEGRRTATLDYDDGFWELLHAFVLLPSRQVMRANSEIWTIYQLDGC
eukprot:10690785-Prorocentrum_lima.AAC.1